MRKIHMMTTFMVALTFGLCACGSTANEKSADTTAVTCQQQAETQQVLSIYGTYEGTLPCADCGGKQTSLSIFEDGTYHLEYIYLDTDERTIEENGVYNLINDTIIETITPSSGNKSYYSFIKGNMVLSDSLGKVNTGELADLYVLKRKQ